MRLFTAGLVLFVLCVAPSQAQNASDRALGGIAICDLLLAESSARRDRGIAELNNLSEARAEDVGNGILTYKVIEARRLLTFIGRAGGDFAAIAAIVCLDSKEVEIRNCALEALMDAPLGAIRKAGDHHLKESRRNTLRGMLIDKGALKPLCEGLPEVDGKPKAPVERTMRLAILADRYFGATGFIGLARALGDMMIGQADALVETAESAEARAHAQRLRMQAAALLGAIWVVSPEKQFNYEPNAPVEERRKAVGRLQVLLTEMETREVQAGQTKFKGVRFGDYLLGFSDSRLQQFGWEVMEVVAASYMRLRWWKGDAVPVEGEGYSDAVAKLNESGRRARSDLRKDIQGWWEGYRAETERK